MNLDETIVSLYSVYNEENNVLNTYETIKKLLDEKLINLNYEIIFADNHSIDGTESIIEKICSKDKKVKYIRYNKNIGYDRSILKHTLILQVMR